jgi:hypothetical protein
MPPKLEALAVQVVAVKVAQQLMAHLQELQI